MKDLVWTLKNWKFIFEEIEYVSQEQIIILENTSQLCQNQFFSDSGILNTFEKGTLIETLMVK